MEEILNQIISEVKDLKKDLSDLKQNVVISNLIACSMGSRVVSATGNRSEKK